MINGLVYLASPYSHPDPAVRKERFHKAAKMAALLMGRKLNVFSAVCHCHPIAVEGGLQMDWSYWKSFDTVMLSRCQAMYVLMIDGWKQSEGIKAEIAIAKGFQIPIYYIEESGRILFLHSYIPEKA